MIKPLEALQACKGGRNPAIELYEEIQAQEGGSFSKLHSIEELLALDARIPKAIGDGSFQYDTVEQARKRLIQTRAQAATAVVEGF